MAEKSLGTAMLEEERIDRSAAIKMNTAALL